MKAVGCGVQDLGCRGKYLCAARGLSQERHLHTPAPTFESCGFEEGSYLRLIELCITQL